MVAVFLGHLYPVFFKFQGGKGVATFMGILFTLSWISGFIFVALWLLVAAIFRFSSLASLVASIFAPIAVAFFLNWQYALPVFIMVVFIFFRHRANIKRLLAGQESKLNFSKVKAS